MTDKKFCLCGKRGSFAILGTIKPVWCTKCKSENAVSTDKRKCTCGKRGSFAILGTTKPVWCTKCKPENAVSTDKRKCTCGKRGIFAMPNTTTPVWCTKCKPEGTIDIKHPKCECGKRPIFNIEGEIYGKWCKKCKPKEAIDVKNKKCECGKQSCFALLGETVGKWCADCKPEEAIDVKNKKCKCGTSPCFNLPGETVGKWCSKCKPKEAVDVLNCCKVCKLISATPKYEGHCLRCFIYLFPDKKVSRNYKVKENHIFDAVIELLPDDLKTIRDKKVGGCSQRRPDLMIDLNSHWICVENDENAHKDYDNLCENKRLMELYTDMANRPMILIRFNCDKYSNGQGLFKMIKSGLLVIRSQKDFKKRINKLVETINKYIDSEPPEKAITIEHLYYDEI